MRERSLIPALAVGLAVTVPACGSGDPAIATRNPVFYAFETSGSRFQNEYETRYPPLDWKAQGSAPEYVGVEVLASKVRISRPASWVLRTASNQPGGRFVQYLSPSEYLVSIYELQELSNAPWPDVLARYEKDLEDAHAEIVHKAVPIATWNAQGRAYLVRRKVPAAKGPFVNLSREYVARGDHRVVLVQVVHQTTGLAPVTPELMRVVQTLELR